MSTENAVYLRCRSNDEASSMHLILHIHQRCRTRHTIWGQPITARPRASHPSAFTGIKSCHRRSMLLWRAGKQNNRLPPTPVLGRERNGSVRASDPVRSRPKGPILDAKKTSGTRNNVRKYIATSSIPSSLSLRRHIRGQVRRFIPRRRSYPAATYALRTIPDGCMEAVRKAPLHRPSLVRTITCPAETAPRASSYTRGDRSTLTTSRHDPNPTIRIVGNPTIRTAFPPRTSTKTLDSPASQAMR
ncbi:hypothetical protein HD554DRAFT_804262 [Boletus coccyginus]|nr:hypothetical protein HD554DRAFT_804262 [Boletus coccyginus]